MIKKVPPIGVIAPNHFISVIANKNKLPERIKFSDYSNQKINSCDKGCGKKIYFDEDFKTEDGKFIPIDKNTGRPHNCKKIKYKKKI